MVGSAATIDLAAEPGVELTGVARLELRRVPDARPSQLSRLPRSSEFVWSCTDEEWRTNAELLDPLIRGEHGPQHLTSLARDAAALEVWLG
jgi:hypothetical protein